MYLHSPLTKISLLTIGAIISFIVGYIGFKTLPNFVLKEIEKRIKLDPSSPIFELWKDAPVTIHHKFYFFNVTNPLEIERLGAKPILTEVGPFVYNLKIKKVPVNFNDNGTVSYKEVKTWYFNRELSAFDEDYVITTVNTPLISAINFLQRAPQVIRVWLSITLDSITEGIFIRRSIKQLTFSGYPDILVSIGTVIDSKTPNTNGRFGYLVKKNESVDALYTVFTGLEKSEKIGLVENIDGHTSIYRWKNEPCSSLNNTYTGQIIYSPVEKFQPNIYMYNDLFGRKLNLVYKGTVDSYQGVKGHRYYFDPNNFKNSIDYPPNACYTSRLPKEVPANNFSESNIPPIADRQSSPGSLLLNLARRRFESSNNPFVNLINRNLLSRPLISVSNGPVLKPRAAITTPASTTIKTTTTTAYPETVSEISSSNLKEENSITNNKVAESLIFTTTTENLVTSTKKKVFIPESTPSSILSLSPESRQDQFGSALSNLLANRARDSPLLSLFSPRDNLQDDNNRLSNRFFNRNGNNILGNLISNGISRLINLRNARKLEENNIDKNSSDKNTDQRTVLSRTVRNALKRATRNTGNNNHDDRQDYNFEQSLAESYQALRKMNLFPSGAFDFSEVAFGAPILLSQPHFLNADPYYNSRLVGMKPDPKKHDFFIDIDPITGASIKTGVKLQVNVALLKSPNIFRFRNFKENIFPVFWQDLKMDLPDNFQLLLKLSANAPNAISEITLCLFIILGVILKVYALLIFAKSKIKNVSNMNLYDSEAIGALNGEPILNKSLSLATSNMVYSTNVNNNNTGLASFNKSNSKDDETEDDLERLHSTRPDELHGIDNPIPVTP